MGNNDRQEVYRQEPGRKLREVLRTSGWFRDHRGYWKKGRQRLMLDDFGIFLYQRSQKWERTHGLTWELIRAQHLRERTIYFLDGYKLSLDD